MIEVQIKDERLYNELKQYASYSSDLTKVCSFRDEMLEFLKEKGVEVDPKYENNRLKQKAVLSITGRNVMELQNAPAEMLYYCGVRSEFDPTISLKYMNEINHLLNNNLIDVDQKFLDVYTKLSYRDRIDSLVCANVRFHGKGRLIDYIDGSLTLQSMRFPEAKEKVVNYRNMLVKVIKGPGHNSTDSQVVKEYERFDEAYVILCDKEGIPIANRYMVLRFYNRPVILKSILYEGNKINISCKKISEGRNGVFIVYDPIILPKGLNLRREVVYSPPNRKIPADLYRNALFEFQCRYNFVYGKEK